MTYDEGSGIMKCDWENREQHGECKRHGGSGGVLMRGGHLNEHVC